MMQDNTHIMVNPNGHSNTTPLYFPVAMSKFAVMFILTFGLYGFFWWYKTWRAMGKNPIRAIILSNFIFLMIWMFVTDLKQHLDTANVANRLKPIKVQLIYLGYFILSIAQHLHMLSITNQTSAIVLKIMALLKLILPIAVLTLGVAVLYFTFYLVYLVNQLNIALNNAHLIDNKYTVKTFLGIAFAICLAVIWC